MVTPTSVTMGSIARDKRDRDLVSDWHRKSRRGDPTERVGGESVAYVISPMQVHGLVVGAPGLRERNWRTLRTT